MLMAAALKPEGFDRLAKTSDRRSMHTWWIPIVGAATRKLMLGKEG